MRQAGLLELPLAGGIALRANALTGLQPDPADRFITGTGESQRASLLTADGAMLSGSDPLPRLHARH